MHSRLGANKVKLQQGSSHAGYTEYHMVPHDNTTVITTMQVSYLRLLCQLVLVELLS